MKRRNFISASLFGLAAVSLPRIVSATPLGLTPEDFQILRAQSKETLAKWWCKLNIWEWPKALPHPEESVYIADGRRSQIMEWIRARTSERLRKRTWNYDMSDDEFEIFWRYHESGSATDRQTWIEMHTSRHPNGRGWRRFDV